MMILDMILEINISKCQHESIPSLFSFRKNYFQIVKIILVAAERIFILSRCLEESLRVFRKNWLAL